MIRFFNGNNPSLILFLLLYTATLNLVLFLFPSNFSLPQTQAPLANLVYFLTGFLFQDNHYVLSVIALSLVFVQSLMFNTLINEIKLFEKRTYVPAVIYILMHSLFRDYLFLIPVLMANTFIIFIISKAFLFFKKQRCFTEIFDMGLLIGISSLFYFPTIILIILLFFALGILRSFDWREWAAGLLGLITAYFLTGTYFFLVDDLMLFINGHILSGVFSLHQDITFSMAIYIISVIIFILCIASFFTIQLNYLKSQVQVRKFFMLIGWTLLLLGLSFLFRYDLSVSHFVVLSVPLSVIITYFFLHIKRALFADILHLLLLATILFFQYYI